MTKDFFCKKKSFRGTSLISLFKDRTLYTGIVERGLSRPKAGFQRESRYRNFLHVSDNNDNNHQTEVASAQNEHGSDRSEKLKKLVSGQEDTCRAQYTRGNTKFRSYGVQRLASVADWRGDFARFELAFPRSDLGL